MKTVVFFLEEPSAREMLKGILPRLIGDQVQFRYLVFNGKQDLEKNLVKKLRGWCLPDSVFIILRDQDAADCHTVKSRVVELCQESRRSNVMVRIACRELESFYLGDLAAVEKGLGVSSISSKQNTRKFRAPDNLGSPSNELFALTRHQYQKVSGSRAISPHLSFSGNRSHSFNALISGIQKMVGPAESHAKPGSR